MHIMKHYIWEHFLIRQNSKIKTIKIKTIKVINLFSTRDRSSTKRTYPYIIICALTNTIHTSATKFMSASQSNNRMFFFITNKTRFSRIYLNLSNSLSNINFGKMDLWKLRTSWLITHTIYFRKLSPRKIICINHN